MFLLDNLYNDLGSKLNMRIELLHVIDHMIYTQQHQNPDIAKQISILYGPSWLSYQKNIRIEFRNGYFLIILQFCLFLIMVRDLIESLRNFFKHQPWDLLMFVDEFTAQFDYLIVLRSPYEFIDEENLEQIINSNFKCGCLVSCYDNNFIEIQNIRSVKIVVWLIVDESVSSECHVDVILIFFEDFVDLCLIEIPGWSIIYSHDFVVFMKFHPSGTTKGHIFHCWKVISIFIHLKSILGQWSFRNSVCIGLKLNDFYSQVWVCLTLENSYLPLGSTF